MNQEERERRVEEGRALFSAYQGSVQQLAIGMTAVGERVERQNQLLEILIRQQSQLLEQNEKVVAHLAQLQRQIAAQVELQGQALGVPIQNVGHSGAAPASLLGALGQTLMQGAINQMGQGFPQQGPPHTGPWAPPGIG